MNIRRPDPTAISPPKLKRVNLATQVVDTDNDSPQQIMHSHMTADRGYMDRSAGNATIVNSRPPRSRQHDGLSRGAVGTTNAGSRLALGAIQLLRTQESALSVEGRVGPLSGRQDSIRKERSLMTGRYGPKQDVPAPAPNTEYRSVYEMSKQQ